MGEKELSHLIQLHGFSSFHDYLAQDDHDIIIPESVQHIKVSLEKVKR